MTVSKNESLWLASGIAGENQARALNQAVEFSKIEVGDANGARPVMDSTLTALVNKIADGELLTYKRDPDDVNQFIVEIGIPPNDNYNAWEIIMYAKYGNTEFPHTYFRLAEPFPVRTIENGGAQALLKYTIRVSQYTDFNILVSPNLAYTTEGQVNSKFKSIDVEPDEFGFFDGIEDKVHIFKDHADVKMPKSVDGSFLSAVVDSSVDLSTGECRLAAPEGEKLEVYGELVSHARIKKNLQSFRFERINGVWKI